MDAFFRYTQQAGDGILKKASVANMLTDGIAHMEVFLFAVRFKKAIFWL